MQFTLACQKLLLLFICRNIKSSGEIFELLQLYILHTHIKKGQYILKGYVDQAKEEKRVKELEKMAQKGVEENEPHAEGIAQIIKRISARHDFEHETWENMFLFYDGGFRLLTAQLTDGILSYVDLTYLDSSSRIGWTREGSMIHFS